MNLRPPPPRAGGGGFAPVRSALGESLLRGASQKRRAVFGALIDTAEQSLRQGYVHPHGAVYSLGQGDEKGYRIAVLGIGHDHLEGARRGQLLAILDHTADMKLDRFLGHAARLIERRAGAHTAREVGEVYAEIARSFLSDQTNIARHWIMPISWA